MVMNWRTLAQDLRHGLRRMGKDQGFTIGTGSELRRRVTDSTPAHWAPVAIK